MMTNYVEVDIRKPLYGNFVYIRDKYIRQAINEGKQLMIQVPTGTGIHDPREWIRTGKKMLKEFKIPGRPMTLWGNHVELIEESSEEEQKSLL